MSDIAHIDTGKYFLWIQKINDRYSISVDSRDINLSFDTDKKSLQQFAEKMLEVANG